MKALKTPTKWQLLKLRAMILIGIISIVSFFYWFLSPDFKGNKVLYWLIFGLLSYDIFRIVYMWYHYWSISVPEKPKLKARFSVDVLTTYFPGEPIEMVTETLLAIVNIKYPHTTYLCDEANNEDLKSFCVKHGIIHVTRTNRIDAKAGNINNALKQATGDLCLILDPDHIPNENFLDEVVPFFADENIGFVQTVQAYYNVNESKIAKGAAQQTYLFYGPLMMGMNSYGTVNAIGANCVFRRAALDSIGGHAPGLSEDLHTAMKLHAKGWKSVYVPKSLTKGLVPATLTSYYQQQLKWSKGTIELLIHEYPKLFKKFTWRQKIHYGILPFHYLSGLGFFIWLLIPIISLLFSITPYRANPIEFLLHLAPILICFLAIRMYVQSWLIYKEERGMHFIGGILLQCTWWVYVVGVLYNVIGKNVLYLPTAKSDFEKTNFKILLPNLIMLAVSLWAIYYGLHRDFTPFSLAMAGFAFWNALIMFSTLFFAYEKRQVYKFVNYVQDYVTQPKPSLIPIIYKFGNKVSFLVIILTLIISSLFIYKREVVKQNGIVEAPVKNEIKYLGVFSPKVDDGITTVKLVKEFENVINKKLSIVSFYYAWKADENMVFSAKTMDSIYKMNAVPMITWEPWLKSEDINAKERNHVFDLINEGHFDTYLKQAALQFKALKRPVFVRFAHEYDNPFYPWFDNRALAGEIYKKAWRHVHDVFENIGATNVIWVWNPWRADSIAAFYPGKDYVDWIGVNILNYATDESASDRASFKHLYDSYHNEILKLPDTPVMISEFGSLHGGENQDVWIKNAHNILKYEFNEIKALVYFNSDLDDNVPVGKNVEAVYNWKFSENMGLNYGFKTDDFSSIMEYLNKHSHSKPTETSYLAFNSVKSKQSSFEYLGFSGIIKSITNPSKLGETSKRILNKKLKKEILKPEFGIKGVNYKKGDQWEKNYYVLDRNTLIRDFSNMHELGLNAIKFKENSAYDRNVLNIADEIGVKICYAFGMPEKVDFLKDTIVLNSIKENILNRIEQYSNKRQIISWNLQNDLFSNLSLNYFKPELLVQQQACLVWLNNLVVEIKKRDAKRPIILDLNLNKQASLNAENIQNNVYALDYIGLVVKDTVNFKSNLNAFKKGSISYLFSEVPVEVLNQDELINTGLPFFVSTWQDQHQINKVAFDGLRDRQNRVKESYLKLNQYLHPEYTFKTEDIIRCNILKPAKVTHSNSVLIYQAFIYDDILGWVSGDQYKKDLSYEWELIKCDTFGNYLAINKVGELPYLTFTIPENNELYRLVLTVSDGVQSVTKVTLLNTPYIQ